MKTIRNSSIVFLIFLLLLNVTACKSKKKAMDAQAAAAERARIEQEAAEQKRKEEAKRKEAEEAAKREAEARKANEPKALLGNYFNAIANSSSVTGANNSIDEALRLFASPDTPVLIVISEEGGQKDYDRPTTISNYLNYLKDQKKNMNKISNVQLDGNGKITELELRKD